jgi:hypothetical protein
MTANIVVSRVRPGEAMRPADFLAVGCDGAISVELGVDARLSPENAEGAGLPAPTRFD